jgi:hypothetical protein
LRRYYNSLVRAPLLQFCRYDKLGRPRIVLNLQQVGLAADLAIFHVGLATSRSFIHAGFIPLSATGTLKTCTHRESEITTFEASSAHTASQSKLYNVAILWRRDGIETPFSASWCRCRGSIVYRAHPRPDGF